MTNDKVVNLHLYLVGPFVLRDDYKDSQRFFRVLIPDVMETHNKPGIKTDGGGAVLDNGVWDMTFSNVRNPSADPVRTDGEAFDTFCWSRSPAASAYAVVRLPQPDCVYGLEAELFDITSDTDGVPGAPRALIATKAVLVYENIDPSGLAFSPEPKWHPGPGAGLKNIDGVATMHIEMDPKETANDEHDMTCYRNMSKMVGVNRFLRPSQTGTESVPRSNSLRAIRRDPRIFRAFEHSKYNDCGSGLMLVRPPS
jgi:hypothetical protein